jgi:hypothetical protein
MTLMRDVGSHAVSEDEASDKNQTDRDADDHWIEQQKVYERNDFMRVDRHPEPLRFADRREPGGCGLCSTPPPRVPAPRSVAVTALSPLKRFVSRVAVSTGKSHGA